MTTALFGAEADFRCRMARATAFAMGQAGFPSMPVEVRAAPLLWQAPAVCACPLALSGREKLPPREVARRLIAAMPAWALSAADIRALPSGHLGFWPANDILACCRSQALALDCIMPAVPPEGHPLFTLALRTVEALALTQAVPLLVPAPRGLALVWAGLAARQRWPLDGREAARLAQELKTIRLQGDGASARACALIIARLF
nr:hypothetical protein [bacterium]